MDDIKAIDRVINYISVIVLTESRIVFGYKKRSSFDQQVVTFYELTSLSSQIKSLVLHDSDKNFRAAKFRVSRFWG
jgi:hypothetical protein